MSQTQRRRFQLLNPLPAVKLEDHPGSTLRSPTPTLLTIPAGSIVETEGVAAKSGLITLLWNGDAFSVFHEDLEKNAKLLTTPDATAH